MKGDAENMQPEGQEMGNTSAEDREEDTTSLEGRGWDILVGGEENAERLGGRDPFDQSPDDTEADVVLGTSRVPEPEAGEIAPPEEAFWDRGRGAELPQPPLPTGVVEAPPRDLTPEELGASPVPPGEEITAEIVEEAETGMPAVEVPSISFDELMAPPAGRPAVAAPVTPAGDAVPRGELAPGEAALTEAAPVPFGEPPGGATPFGVPFAGTEATSTPFGAPAVPPAQPAEAPVVVPQMADTVLYDPFRQQQVARPVERAEELPTDEELERRLITPERVDALWKEIDETYNLAIADVRGYFQTTEAALADLKKARELLLAGSENFDNAEELVMRVKARLRLEEKVRQWSRTIGVWLAVYLVLWLLLLSVTSLVIPRIQALAEQFVPVWMAATILPGLFGGLGGVVGALWFLIKHIARDRDFDPIHTSWYVTNPFLGFALGVITYFVVIGGGRLMGGSETFAETAADSRFMHLLCIIVGFNQNLLWSLIDRVIKAIVPPVEDTPAAEQMSGGPESEA